MIPILFEEKTTNFETNGIGRLSDALSCTVTEERNGIFELELQYPVDGALFSSIRHSTIILAKPNDKATEQPFRIYKISKPLNKRITVNAEHISYQLSYIPVSPFKASNAVSALSGLKGHAAEACPFDFWTDKSVSAEFSVSEPASIRSRLGGVEGSILDLYGGEYEFDRYQVKLHASRGADNGVKISYGKNLTDIKQEESIENTITGIYPYWKDSDGNMVVLPEKTVSAASATNYPFRRTIPMDFSSDFEDAPTIAQLRKHTEKYISDNKIGIPKVSITVSFQPLWQANEFADVASLEKVGLCDIVTVEYEKLGVSTTAKVNKTVYDVLKEKYANIEIGEARSNLSDKIISQENAIEEKPGVSFLQQAIASATNLITGNKGGYIVYMYDGDGKPYEMLIMDKPDIQSAENVWRFNQAGLGHSSTGYAGPYTTAITQDGKIVADFITAGTMMANLIKSGTLSDVSGKNTWNLDTGEMIMEKLKITGGSIHIKSDSNSKNIIELSNPMWGTTLEIKPSGLAYKSDIGNGQKKFWSIGSNIYGINGLVSGIILEETENSTRTQVNFYVHDNNGETYDVMIKGYPSFSFQSADGKIIDVSTGLISGYREIQE